MFPPISLQALITTSWAELNKQVELIKVPQFQQRQIRRSGGTGENVHSKLIPNGCWHYFNESSEREKHTECSRRKKKVELNIGKATSEQFSASGNLWIQENHKYLQLCPLFPLGRENNGQNKAHKTKKKEAAREGGRVRRRQK